jgi:carbamoyltransferase
MSATKWVLGISSFYHDAAAAIVRDGEIVAAAQEERFSRKKHDPRFPVHAINYCLEEAMVEPDDLDAVAFYDNPLLTWDRVVKNCMQAGAPGAEQFAKASRSVLGIKMWVADQVEKAIGTLGKAGKVLFCEHHMSHAASCFYPSPYEEAAVLTLDGVGEWATTTLGMGRGSKIELLQEIDYPHSLGLLYSAFTHFCGFKVNSGEYKLMGLAPYGVPRYVDAIKEHLIDIRDDGSYRLDLDYFSYVAELAMTGEKFANLFGGPAREQESRITRREMDLAASIQAVTNEVVLKIGKHLRKTTGARYLTMAGGVALNCVANGLLLREGTFDGLWIQPAAGDAGGAVGSALAVTHQYFGLPRAERRPGEDDQRGSYLGPKFESFEIQSFLDEAKLPYEHIEDADERAAALASLLDDGKVIGFFSGRMEFGPRALGARSIIGDARKSDTQQTMNLKIKYRESFRPFAPSVLRERVSEYFDMDCDSPYMLLVAPVKEDRCTKMSKPVQELGEDMLSIVNEARSDIPAITHVDYSARIQTVRAEDHPEYHRLIEAFRKRTGYGVIVNTSFNVRGEPIVCTPQDAYRCFMRTEMDALVLEDCVLHKAQQPAFQDDENWRQQYDD